MKTSFKSLLAVTVCCTLLAGCSTATLSNSSSAAASTPVQSAPSSAPAPSSSASSSEATGEKKIIGFVGDATAMSVITVDTEDGCGYMFRMDDVRGVMTGDVEYGASVVVTYEGELAVNDADNITVKSFLIDGSKKLPTDANGQSLRTFYGTVSAESSMDTLVVLAGNGLKYAFSGTSAATITGNTGKGLVEGTPVALTYTGEVNQYGVENGLYIADVTVTEIEIK